MSLDKLKESIDLEKEYLDAEEEYFQAWREFSSIPDYKEVEQKMKPYADKVNECSRKYRLIKIPKLKPIPDYGDLMTLEEFINCVNSDGFIDYDGHGRYSDEINMTDIIIYPSDIKNNSVREDFTHIVWFNK